MPPVLRPEDEAAALGERLAGLRDGHAAGGRAAAPFLSASVAVAGLDAVSLAAAAIEADLEVTLWLRPSEGLALVGVGRAWATEGVGPGRFREAETAWHAALAAATVDRAAADDARARDGDGVGAAPVAGPVLLGALGFTGQQPPADGPWGPFGSCSLVLPELMLAITGDDAILTGSLPGDARPTDVRALERRWERLAVRARAMAPSPSGMVAMPVYAPLTIERDQPSHEHWRRLVGMFSGAVGRGRIDKVVLARQLDLRSPVELDVPNALRRLAAAAPESTTYAFRRGGRVFLGATPERLVRTEGRVFRTAAVAGSIRRGADDAEDAALAAELLRSEKDREEQAIVVSSIRDLLAPVAATLEISPQPSVMTLRFVQHLVTEISGTLPGAHGLLALAERLHPTPAVGGEPRDVALALIEEHEGFDRGWYAGPIGWLGADGDGELCVALRCGIVDRTRATLFAGCGIVADSDPDREWEESRIKLRAVVSALGHLGEPA
jgi:isochorismate synthase